MFALSLNTDPVPAARPRVTSKGWTYYPTKYKTYKAELGMEVQQVWASPRLDGPLELRVKFFVRPPAKSKLSHPKPDVDNYIKGLLDALNGRVFNDDHQVVKITAEKHWAPSPADVGILVEIDLI